MRTKQDNLLKLAQKYEDDFTSDYEPDEVELNRLFASVIKDYGKIYKRCSKEGIDAGDSEVVEYKNDFKLSTSEEKEELINRVKERILLLAEACDIVPEDIDDKYSRTKDLVSMFETDILS